MTLDFRINGQHLALIGNPFVVAESYDFLEASFTFTDDWADAVTRKAYFKLDDDTYEVPIVDDAIAKTAHINLAEGAWLIYVVGYDSNGDELIQRIPTNTIELNVHAVEGFTGGLFPEEYRIAALLQLDQTVPQTLSAPPLLAATRVINADHQLVDKKYVDDHSADLTSVLALDQTTPQTTVGTFTFDAVKIDTTATPTTAAAGLIQWNATDGTYDMGLLNTSKLQVGQEIMFYGKASGAIANGDACQFAGAQGDHILVKKAVGVEIMANPRLFIGVATENIANGEYGYVTWLGKINGIYTATPANQDSASWVAGDVLYISPTSGQLTKTMPTSANVIVSVGAVIKAQTGASENGIIMVRPQIDESVYRIATHNTAADAHANLIGDINSALEALLGV